MKYCEKCKVVVPSGRERCPLCQRFLTETDQQGYDDEIFSLYPDNLSSIQSSDSVFAVFIRHHLRYLHHLQSAVLDAQLVVTVCSGRSGGWMGYRCTGNPQTQFLLQTCSVSAGHHCTGSGHLRPDEPLHWLLPRVTRPPSCKHRPQGHLVPWGRCLSCG